MAGRDPQDADSSRPGHVFRHVNINDSGRAHLGDTYKISNYHINPMINSDARSSQFHNKHFELPRDPSPVFTGREEVRELLRSNCLPSSNLNTKEKPRRFVIHGLGGSGKTQVCLKFMGDYREKFWGIFWVDASSRESLERGFLQIANICALEPSVNTVKQWLSNATESWALILDNADDPRMDISPYFPVGNRGVLLITTRNPYCEKHATVGSYKMDTMTPDEAVTLILKRIGVHDLSDASIRETAKPIVEELGCLALAIVQAGAVIGEGRCKIEEYSAIYSRRRKELLSQKAVQGGGDYGYTVNTTWEVSWKMIEELSSEAGRDAIELLKIFSFLHHDGISEEMFHRAWKHMWSGDFSRWMILHQSEIVHRQTSQEWDVYPLGKALSLLLSFSLINRDKNHMISIHPLVHTWARDRLCSSDKETMWALTISTVAMSIPWNTQAVDYRFRRSLVLHIDACLSDQSDRLFDLHVAGEDRLDMLSSFAVVYQEAGRRQDALQLGERVTEKSKETLGEEHTFTLARVSNLAVLYEEMGRRQEALQLNTQLVKTRKKNLGNEHPETLASLQNLATVYSKMGQRRRALELQEEVVEARERTLGEEDSDTLTSMLNLASYYGHVGREEEALKLTQKVVKANWRILGSENPETHTAVRALANMVCDSGRMEEGLGLMKSVEFESRRTLGEEHPATLDTTLNLAVIYSVMGQEQNALLLAEEVMEASKRILGEEHLFTLTSIHALAIIYDNLHRHQESLQLREWLVPAYITILGKGHPHTLLSMRNLATCYEAAGRQQEARRLRKQANQGRESEEEDSTREVVEELLPEKDSLWEVEDDSGEYTEEDSEDSEEDSGEEMET